jgi:hypothetical protein
MLGWIATAMVNAGPIKAKWPSGEPKSNGVILGFMSIIAQALIDARMGERIRRIVKANARKAA